jgi:hypothetical protein
MQRFEQAPNAPGTQRLFYLASGLNPNGTPMKHGELIAKMRAAGYFRPPLVYTDSRLLASVDVLDAITLVLELPRNIE